MRDWGKDISKEEMVRLWNRVAGSDTGKNHSERNAWIYQHFTGAKHPDFLTWAVHGAKGTPMRRPSWFTINFNYNDLIMDWSRFHQCHVPLKQYTSLNGFMKCQWTHSITLILFSVALLFHNYLQSTKVKKYSKLWCERGKTLIILHCYNCVILF